MAWDRDAAVLAAHTDDGVSLAVHHFPARGSRRAVCLCTHAMMANSSYFRAGGERGFVAHLTRRGIEVFTLDWRGHGASIMPAGRDAWYFEDYVTRDAPTAVHAVCRRAGIQASELAYLGHSLGGLVGLAALATGTVPDVRRLSLWATSVWLPGARGPRRRRWLMRALELSSRGRGRAPIRRLRLGSDDEPASYVRELAGWARSGRWHGRDGRDFLAELCGWKHRCCRYRVPGTVCVAPMTHAY